MAFDPSTVFQATAVRPIGPLEAQAKVAQLRALQNGNQLDQMRMDELRRQQQQQQNIRAAAQGAVGPQQGSYTVPGVTLGDAQLPDRTVNTVTPGIKTFDRQKFLQNLMQSDPLAAQGFQAQDAAAQQEQQKQQIAMQEQLSKLHSTKLDQASKELELSGRSLMGIKQLPPEQQPQAYTLARQGLIQQGIAHESQLPEQFPGAQGLDALVSRGMTVQQAVQQEQERRKEAQTQTNQNLQLGSKTVETAKGVMQFNPATGAYDKRVGGLKPNKSATDPGFGTVPGNPALSGEQYISTLPTAIQGNVRQIGTGRMPINRMEALLKGSPAIAAAVSQAYPDFDASKISAYKTAQTQFTTGKESDQINAGAVAIQHLAQLKQINDASPAEVRIPGTKANKAYNNLLDTVADELLTFYGEPKTNESIASKKSTLGGLMNRDSAIVEQAQAMGVKFDEMDQKWTNAAPSSAYQAPMPGVSGAAKKARAYLDPNYKGARQQSAPQSALNSAPAAGGVQPMYATNPQTKQRIVSNDGGQSWQLAQ